MILFQKDDHIVARIDYAPEIVQQFKKIPGASFDQWEWIFPKEAMNHAWEALKLRPAHLYPYLKGYVPKGLVPGTKAYYDGKKLILIGKSEHLDYLIENLQILCGYEEVVEEYKRGQGRIYTRIAPTLLEVNAVKAGFVTLSFPKGLAYRVKTFLTWLDVEYHEKPHSEIPKPSLVFPGSPKYPARDYQQKIAAQAPQVRRATLVKPTGSGKTRTAGEIIRTLGLPSLFLTDSRLLLRQTAKSLAETLNIPIGVVGAGTFQIEPVTVATIQTIYAVLGGRQKTFDMKALKREVAVTKELHKGLTIPNNPEDKREAIIRMLARTELLIVDEAHTLGSEMIYSVASLADPTLSFGLTATPQREDEHGIFIEAATGPIWRPISEQKLIEEGYLLPVKVWAVPFRHSKRYQGSLRDMQDIKLAAIIENPKRNALLIQLARKFQDRYRTLLLVNEKEHAENLAKQLGTTFITSETKTKDQEEAIRALRMREIRTLVATPLLEQGVDIPEVELLIDGVPKKSVRRLIQAAGRIRRPGPKKTYAYIVTVLDFDNEGMFEKQSARKLHILKQAGFEIIFSQ